MAQPQYKNNPLAPPWLWSDTYCPEPGADDRYHQYVLKQAMTASEARVDQPFLFDGDGCFVIRLFASSAAGGTYYILWRDELGRYISNQPLSIPGFCGAGGQHLPVVPVQVVPPGSRWSFNIEEISGAEGGTAYFVLIGVKQRGRA